MAKTEPIALEQTMISVVALLAAMREEGATQKDANWRKTEVVLADVGLTPGQIAALLGKKPNSVSKTIARARKGASGDASDE